MQRIALVIHPSRPIDEALGTLREWAESHDVEVVQLELPPGNRQVAGLGDAGPCDLVVGLGGDGTVLTALRASAATRVPVLGVACGSLGALTATPGDGVTEALDRFAAGDWLARELPALDIASEEGSSAWALNDVNFLRGESGQLVAELSVDGELYARLAGDGVIVATTSGSSAYSMAAGGPIVAGGADVFVCTPLAMHGGNAPPIVVPGDATVGIVVHPGFASFGIDIDGHRQEMAGVRFEVTRRPAKVRLVDFSEEVGRGLSGLRRRGLIIDSPRLRARDARDVARATTSLD